MKQQKTNCNFEIANWKVQNQNYYTCTIVDKSYQVENGEFELIGKHLEGKTNKDVEAISFYNSYKIRKIPQGLTKVFPNIKVISIIKSKLKQIERSDLKEYENLTNLYFYSNKIEFLPADLFADLKHLQIIDFGCNKIQLIEPGVLDGLNKLQFVDFSKNSFINKCFDLNASNGNASLNEIKQEIYEKFEIAISKFESPWNKIINNFFKIKSNYENGISSDLKRVIQNDDFKDFTIKVENEEFKVHKMVLAARSSVLSKMIHDNVDAKILNLADMPAQIFRLILNYIYTDEFPTSDDINFIQFLKAAEKLEIEKLKEYSAEKLIEQVNAENAFELLILANKHEHDKLRQKAFDEIKKILGEESIDGNFAIQTDRLKMALQYKKERDEYDAKIQAVLNEK